MKYNELEKLFELKEKGILSEQEYQAEKEKILGASQKTTPTPTSPTPNILNEELFGLSEKSFCTLLHVSQLFGILVPGLGFVVPLILWIAQRDKNAVVDEHGKVVMNWVLTSLLYAFGCFLLVFIVIGLPLFILLVIADIVFIVIGASKAYEGKLWKYPLSLKIF